MANKDDLIEKKYALQDDVGSLQKQQSQSWLKADDENSVNGEHVEAEQNSLAKIVAKLNGVASEAFIKNEFDLNDITGADLTTMRSTNRPMNPQTETGVEDTAIEALATFFDGGGISTMVTSEIAEGSDAKKSIEQTAQVEEQRKQLVSTVPEQRQACIDSLLSKAASGLGPSTIAPKPEMGGTVEEEDDDTFSFRK